MMIQNTLTTIDKLTPGDLFYIPGKPEKFKLIPGKPIRQSKHLYEYQAEKVNSNSLEPIPFRKNIDVIYFGKSICD